MCSDPFPALAYQDALHVLQECFGRDAVRWDKPFAAVIIRLPKVTGDSGLLRFTWQQAKYLAVHPALFRTIILRRYPVDWPV